MVVQCRGEAARPARRRAVLHRARTADGHRLRPAVHALRLAVHRSPVAPSAPLHRVHRRLGAISRRRPAVEPGTRAVLGRYRTVEGRVPPLRSHRTGATVLPLHRIGVRPLRPWRVRTRGPPSAESVQHHVDSARRHGRGHPVARQPRLGVRPRADSGTGLHTRRTGGLRRCDDVVDAVGPVRYRPYRPRHRRRTEQRRDGNRRFEPLRSGFQPHGGDPPPVAVGQPRGANRRRRRRRRETVRHGGGDDDYGHGRRRGNPVSCGPNLPSHGRSAPFGVDDYAVGYHRATAPRAPPISSRRA